MAKTDKLLYLVNLIKSNHNLNAKQLAQKCGVSDRTIFRYINSLAAASLPIYNDHGYKFLDSAFLPTLNLTDAELSTLQFAFEFSPIKSDPLLANTANSILAKLETSRKNSYAPNGAIRSEKPPRSSPSKDADTTPPSSREVINFFTIFRWLSQSIDKKKVAKVKYKKQELLVEPLGFLHRNSTWQVICKSREVNQTIFLDVGRVENISLTNQTFKSKLNLNRLSPVHK